MTTTTIRTPAKIIPHAFPGIKPDEVGGDHCKQPYKNISAKISDM